MVLIDASQHLWLEERGPRWNLLVAMDDASGKILGGRAKPHSVRADAARVGDRLHHGPQSPSQGRIERLWETLQDRLVAELRLRGIDTIEAAEAFLPEFIRDYNQRFARPARDCASAWRPLHGTSNPSCPVATRAWWHATTPSRCPGAGSNSDPGGNGRSWQGCRVEARELIDGRLLVFHRDNLIAEQPWPQPTPFTLVPRYTSPERRVQLGIDLPESSMIDDRLAVRARIRPPKTGIGQFTKIRRPKPNHPWKQTTTLTAPTKVRWSGT